MQIESWPTEIIGVIGRSGDLISHTGLVMRHAVKIRSLTANGDTPSAQEKFTLHGNA